MATECNASTEESRIAALRQKYIVCITLLVTAATYLGTIRFEFVYDDLPIIVTNPFLRAWHYVPQYFVSSAWKQTNPLELGNYYRPMLILLMRINYALFAARPLGWHVVGLTIHLMVTWLTYILVRKTTGEFTIAWLAALIFGVHPIHHEVVAWVTCTSESLFALVFLLAFLAYLRSRDGSKTLWMTISCAVYALAVLTKETAIVLPALVFAYGWIQFIPVDKESHPSYAARFRSAFIPASFYLPIAVLYLLLRNRVLSGLGHAVTNVTPMTWLFTLPSILLFYARNWFLPFRLSEFYDLFYQSRPGFVPVILPLIILIALAGVIWTLRNRLGAKAVDCAIAWVVISLSPALDTFVFKSDELVHDRYFYLPSIGAALLVALLVTRAFRTRRVVLGQPLHVFVAASTLTVTLAFITGWSVNSWRNDYALFSRAHQIAPLNATALNNLAGALVVRNDIDGAQKLMETGYRNYPADFHFALNLGYMYYGKGEYQKAESMMQDVKEIDPTVADPYVILGQIQLKQGHPKEAQVNMGNAVRLNPYLWSLHTIYGVVLAQNGDCPRASQEFEAALALNPGEAITQAQLARCHAKQSSALPSAAKPGLP